MTRMNDCLAICALALGFANSALATPSLPTDLDGDGTISILDVLMLANAVRNEYYVPNLDINEDGSLNAEDIETWHDLAGFPIGDVNLDGVFDSTDLVVIFASGEYDDGIDNNSDYLDGDFNGDGDFDSKDLVFGMQ